MIRLTWNEFDQAVDAITAACRDLKLNGVYGVPRGGLPLAVALSHRLNLPLAIVPSDPRVLVVDDICDSGRTLSYLRNEFGYRLGRIWVWVTREAAPRDYHAVRAGIGEEWVVFPWEDPAQAEEDRQAYEARR